MKPRQLYASCPVTQMCLRHMLTGRDIRQISLTAKFLNSIAQAVSTRVSGHLQHEDIMSCALHWALTASLTPVSKELHRKSENAPAPPSPTMFFIRSGIRRGRNGLSRSGSNCASQKACQKSALWRATSSSACCVTGTHQRSQSGNCFQLEFCRKVSKRTLCIPALRCASKGRNKKGHSSQEGTDDIPVVRSA